MRHYIQVQSSCFLGEKKDKLNLKHQDLVGWKVCMSFLRNIKHVNTLFLHSSVSLNM